MTEPKPRSSKNPSNSRSKARHQEAINAFLVAADNYAKRGEVIEAELRFKQALSTAEKEFGKESDQAMLVLSILAAFYHFQKRTWEARTIECRLEAWTMPVSEPEVDDTARDGALGKQLLSKSRQNIPALDSADAASKSFPAHIRKACQILGMPPDKGFTVDSIGKAWKNQMKDSAAHPDLGGNAEEAVILNKAKDTLVAFLESLEPKLGSKFKKTSH